MQIQLTAPRLLRHQTALPASKSISNRALIIHALAGGTDLPQNISDCDDTLVMTRALSRPTPEPIDILAAGTAMRFLSAYWAVNEGTHTLTGTARMKQRPIGILVEALRQLGAQVEYVEQEGYPPLRITGGPHKGGRLTLPGNVSSQYISALLMTGPVLQEGLALELTGEIISRPYIDLTLKLMKDYGAEAEWTGGHCIRVAPVPYRPIPYYIENDWSAASYWYEMMALAADTEAEVVLTGLFADSPQGDSAVRNLFEPLGVHTEFLNRDGVSCVRLTRRPRDIRRMEYDFTSQPDLAQTLVVTCAMLGLPFHFGGLQSLKIKETDRIAALIRELGKLGYPLHEAHGSELYWEGDRIPAEAQPAIDTYEDHRMAMAFAPCSLALPSIRINDPQVVSKSYPRYWDHLRAAGFEINTL